VQSWAAADERWPLGGASVTDGWDSTCLTDEGEAQRVFLDLRGKRWLFRGQPKQYGGLAPSIDRNPLYGRSRVEKLTLERRSIDLFRSTARFFAHPGEQEALYDDIVALMVLRHYGVPSRIPDWSRSPWVAVYFAVEKHDAEDGEVWAFDEPFYERKGAEQWKQWPETTSDGTGDASKFAAGLPARLARARPPRLAADGPGLEPAERFLQPTLLLRVHAVQSLGGLPALVLGEELGEGRGVEAAPRHAETLSKGFGRINEILRDYCLSDRYASRSALNDPSHSSSPTRTAIAVPVNAGVAGPRAISVTAIVSGSIVATM
jgi:hypothetical protein